MNRDYPKAASDLLHQAFAVKLCELAGVDMDHVHGVDIHCTAFDYPEVTFTYLLHGPDEDAVVEEVKRYVLRPAQEKETP